MPGKITHSWNGTVLTITTDSGTSSADLKGDDGCRGPQGPAGIVYDADGNIIMEGYATEAYVDAKVANVEVDLTGYATEAYVDQKVAAATPPEVDLTGYATEAYVDAKIDAIDIEIPEVDLTGYATEDYVDQKLELMEFPDLEDYATKDYVDTTTTVALSNYYTKDEVDETISNLEPGTGGGGGSDNNATLTLKNSSGWLYKIIAVGGECLIKGTWASTEDGLATGNGLLSITINGVVKHTEDVPQGTFSVDISSYLTTGTNSVRVSITDVYTNTRSIIYSVEVVAAAITSTFDATVPHTGAIDFPYVATGNVEKTVYFKLDGKQIGTQIVTTSGRQETFTIPSQTHGAHLFEVYFTGVISGTTVESNHLIYDLICTESGVTTPIVASDFTKKSITQFETAQIYYSVYTPDSLTSEVELWVNDECVKELMVDRTQQLWTFRADEAGTANLAIKSGTASKTITLTINPAAMDVVATTNNLELYLSSYGRSNSETDPASWTYKDIECEFSGYNWTSDGWVADANGLIVHRISGNARLNIPLLMFQDDARDTGKTIEIEFATRNILDYDAVIASCMADGIGFEMTPQKAIIQSEQSAITTPYKEDEHIRLSFVIEKRAENRLVYTYLNGIMCGAVQYADEDNFSQSSPVGISLGSNLATLDVYTIRVYNNNLTRYQILDNWIADTQDINERYTRYTRNKVYDSYGNIVISNLPNYLPYLILEAPALPDYKGNEVTVKATYTDPTNKDKSFEFAEAIADVQGTSSAGYVRKNYIIEYPETYQLRANSIPTNIFTYKADVASSEGANNVELVRLYNDISPYRTPPQLENENVRQGIDGFPIVIFHNDGTNTKFIGKYNFNNDKKTPEVFGFEPGDESWEIRNNTSNRVLFKSADFEGTDWLNDFEARYPEDNTDVAKLAAFAEWVASTDTTGCDEATTAARLAKFKNELADHAEVQSALFYYLFTELFLMVDSRAKNAFPTFYDDKVCWLPYDMDTALGINNEGALTFGYELEDTDQTASGADVYNGQQSVFWNNLRDTHGDELKAMYQKLRSDKVLTYEIVEKMFEDHQSVWPEAIWNEDAWYKYLQPLVESNNGSYLAMLQGNKVEQRKWWLYNRFRYLDSKYNAGDAETDFITLRGYEKADISVEPYADIYATIKYGSYVVQKRALRGDSYTLECPLDTLNDTEIYIYSSSQLKDVGDLSGLKVGYADFSSATRLQSLKLGEANSSYSNSNLTELYLGNNALLHTLDARNCPMLGSGANQQSVDLSGCANIENVYLDGTTVKGCSLPNGGILKTLHLPSTITNLTIRNQKYLTDLSIPDYSNISTLRLENVSESVDMDAILRGIKAGSRVRLLGVSWNFDTYDEAAAFFDVLDTMKGLDENGKNMEKPQLSGVVHIPEITSAQLENLKSRYGTLTYTYDTIAYDVIYLNYDGSLLYSYTTAAGNTAIDPVATGRISKPTKPGVTGISYEYIGWGTLPIVNETTTLTAQFKSVVATYQVKFYNNGTLLQTVTVEHGSAAKYTGARPTPSSTDSIFAGWYPQPTNVVSNMTISALFASSDKSEAEITDDWSTILASISNGTYASKYHRGMFKRVYVTDTITANIYLIGFASDITADGSLAPMSWAINATWNTGKEVQWHSDLTSSGVLSWKDCALRQEVQSALEILPQTVRNHIVAVRKRSNAYTAFSNSTGAQQWQMTNDYAWIPSVDEFTKDKTYLEDGTVLSDDYYLFPANTYGNYIRYWTRDKAGTPMGTSVTNDYTKTCAVEGSKTGNSRYYLTATGVDGYNEYTVVGFCLA